MYMFITYIYYRVYLTIYNSFIDNIIALFDYRFVMAILQKKRFCLQYFTFLKMLFLQRIKVTSFLALLEKHL